MAITGGLHILSAAKVRAESVIASAEAPPPPAEAPPPPGVLRLSNGRVEAPSMARLSCNTAYVQLLLMPWFLVVEGVPRWRQAGEEQVSRFGLNNSN